MAGVGGPRGWGVHAMRTAAGWKRWVSSGGWPATTGPGASPLGSIPVSVVAAGAGDIGSTAVPVPPAAVAGDSSRVRDSSVFSPQ